MAVQTAKALSKDRLQKIKEGLLEIPAVKQLKKGFNVAEDQMTRNNDFSHTILDRKYYQELAKGKKRVLPVKDKKTGKVLVKGREAIPSITPLKTPLQFAGALGARLLTDIGNDSTRRFYWHYNHPMPIMDKVTEQVIGKGYAKDILPKREGGTGRFSPTDQSLIRLATIGLPVGASLGHLDLTNPGEQFRAKGYKQKYAPEGADDRRKTSQVAPELIDRVFLGRRGRPLKYETAKADIPDLTPQRYGGYMRYAYQDKGLTGLGLVKGTMANLEGNPELSIVGFPIGLQAGGAVAGGAMGLRGGLRNKNIGAGKIAARGGGYALAGALAGKLSNMAIASANRPKYPTTLEYQ